MSSIEVKGRRVEHNTNTVIWSVGTSYPLEFFNPNRGYEDKNFDLQVVYRDGQPISVVNDQNYQDFIEMTRVDMQIGSFLDNERRYDWEDATQLKLGFPKHIPIQRALKELREKYEIARRVRNQFLLLFLLLEYMFENEMTVNFPPSSDDDHEQQRRKITRRDRP